jgi:hypothetical protein
MRKLTIAAIVISLVILAVWGLYGIIKKDLKPTDNWKGCKIGNQCTTKDGWKVLIIAEGGKK